MKLSRTQLDIALANAGLSSYKQLAQRLGCSPQNLSVIVSRGRCTGATAAKLANALNVPVEKIIEEKE